MRCRCRHPQHCGCNKPIKEIVHPVKKNVVHHCTEEIVKHIHPSHTTIVNHHLVKNKHVYPHSTSVANTFNEVDMYGPSNSNQSPTGMGPGNEVAGVMNNQKGANCNKHGWGKKHMKKNQWY